MTSPCIHDSAPNVHAELSKSTILLLHVTFHLQSHWIDAYQSTYKMSSKPSVQNTLNDNKCYISLTNVPIEYIRTNTKIQCILYKPKTWDTWYSSKNEKPFENVTKFSVENFDRWFTGHFVYTWVHTLGQTSYIQSSVENWQGRWNSYLLFQHILFMFFFACW